MVNVTHEWSTGVLYPARGRLSFWLQVHHGWPVHAGDGNQFMGMVELPENVIVQLELSIDKKPMNMQSEVLVEAELVKKINKYLYSSHGHGDFGDQAIL